MVSELCWGCLDRTLLSLPTSWPRCDDGDGDHVNGEERTTSDDDGSHDGDRNRGREPNIHKVNKRHPALLPSNQDRLGDRLCHSYVATTCVSQKDNQEAEVEVERLEDEVTEEHVFGERSIGGWLVYLLIFCIREPWHFDDNASTRCELLTPVPRDPDFDSPDHHAINHGAWTGDKSLRGDHSRRRHIIIIIIVNSEATTATMKCRRQW
ncbi:hypothetical protein EDB85DRAFT_1900032 [Lactarius pseudohatsudake]|nr:hypothetical protein EDB85DRAFT_1900032 [Lactarius pseudohatsudake]